MELKIYNPTVEKPIADIDWNYQELKKELSLALEKYQGVVITNDTVREGKKELANLRRLKTAIEEKRKQIKAYYLAPYADFEIKIKEVVGLIDKPIDEINKQIKYFDDLKKQEKEEALKKYFEEESTERNISFVPWDKVFDKKWTNVTFKEEDAKNEIIAYLDSVTSAIQTITSISSNFTFDMQEFYKKTLSLEGAIAEGQRLEEVAKKKAEIEAQQKLEQEAAAKVPENPIPEWKPESKEEQTQKGPVHFEAPQERVPDSTAEKVYTMILKVRGTYLSLKNLTDYMMSEHIYFEPIKNN